MTDNIGRADYELGADYSELRRDLDAAEREIKEAGRAGEQAFSTQATQGANRFGDSIDGVRGKVGRAGDSLKTFATGAVMGAGFAAFNALTGAVQGAVQWIGESARAFEDDQRSLKQLDAALVANVSSWDGNTGAIEEAIAARMRLGFGDEEQRDSLGRLTAITKDHTKALELQRLAMDLARLRGIDLAAASDIVGKVYGGNLGILSRYGIVLEKGATSTEALAQVQRMAAGQAEAYAETNEGKLVASQIRVGEAQERIGELMSEAATVIMPAFASALEVVVDGVMSLASMLDFLNGKVPNTLEGQAQMAQGWLDLAASVPVFGSAVGALADANQAATEAVLQAHREQVASWANLAVETYRNSALAADGSMQAVEDARASWAETTDAFAGELPTSMEDAKDEAVRVAHKTPLEIAAALRDQREAWQDAVDQLGDDMENSMSRTAEIAAIKAELAGDNLAKGLRSKDPVVRAQANATKDLLIQRLAKLETEAYIEGVQGGEGLKDGLDSKGGAVSGAAGRLKRKVKDALGDIPTWAWGRNAAANFAEGLESKQHAVETAASHLAGAVGSYLKVSSPAEKGPLSTLGGPEGWGERFGDLYSVGTARGLSALQRILDDAGAQLRDASPGSFDLSGFPATLGSRGIPAAMASTGPLSGSSRTVQVNGGIHVSVELPQGVQASEADLNGLMERIGNHVRMTLVPHLSGL